MKPIPTFTSDLSKREFPLTDRSSRKMTHKPILALMKIDFPDFSADQFLSISELNLYREKYISNYLSNEIGELSKIEDAVSEELKESESTVSKVEETRESRTFGQLVADKVADFCGQWEFIILFCVFIVLWILANIYILYNKGFDPYQFILLNLILYCLSG